eukprot:CAMPEP_0182545744 /NCGR_PEP_ID=MMETSP1323-20130603/34962_1 /TAXON_ID=236787 /ORGANISM="Florenciella parvula, Strain RCC1693" /LENGTH=221 /DNA_ID=CAMNT_0024756911 /DNA_START=199 /DNA_END=865 /DNA_ORIENTATION=-
MAEIIVLAGVQATVVISAALAANISSQADDVGDDTKAAATSEIEGEEGSPPPQQLLSPRQLDRQRQLNAMMTQQAELDGSIDVATTFVCCDTPAWNDSGSESLKATWTSFPSLEPAALHPSFHTFPLHLHIAPEFKGAPPEIPHHREPWRFYDGICVLYSNRALHRDEPPPPPQRSRAHHDGPDDAHCYPGHPVDRAAHASAIYPYCMQVTRVEVGAGMAI